MDLTTIPCTGDVIRVIKEQFWNERELGLKESRHETRNELARLLARCLVRDARDERLRAEQEAIDHLDESSQPA